MRLTNPQTFNRYSYVGNDPVNRIDLSGLDDTPSIGTFSAGNIYAGPDPATTLPVMIGSNIVMRRPQDPLKLPNAGHEIYRKMMERTKMKRIERQALKEYQSCVSKSSEYIEYWQAVKVASARASIPLPGAIGLGKITARTVQGIQQGRGLSASLLTRANAFTFILGAIFNILTSNVEAETKPWRDKLQLVEERCKSEIQEKYGLRAPFSQ